MIGWIKQTGCLSAPGTISLLATPMTYPDYPYAGMVFGAPWWDHFFPLLMLMQGCRIYQIEPAAMHLNHTERWNRPVWEALGQRFVAEIKNSR